MREAEASSKHTEELAEAGREFYRRGWVLGTSGNFSTLLSSKPMRVCITASGGEKGKLDETGFLEVDDEVKILSGIGKPSAETLLHLTIYNALSSVTSVLHTHSVWGTILSEKFSDHGMIEIKGYEMLKGLSGVTTHEHTEEIPVIANSQDYAMLANEIERVLRENTGIHGIDLHRHGLYTWGETVAEA